MKRFDIGPGVTCDLDRLVDTRLLVQANSGGGKSWLLRRLLEQTHGHVQHLVIDPEGEFASLRERFDYVLAARSGGDTAADPRSAALLAERLLELKVSAILDIYELKPHERILFVRRFLEALIDAPKALWHPALVVVDEAHVYCPQVGEAESAGAVKDLATRGRKRGFCAVLATQRLSKLHKDAAAECNNKLIGRTALDVDVDRAGDELGIAKSDRRLLRDMQAGEFYAFGPALVGPMAGINRVHVGDVATTHPKAGARLAFTAPPPTSKVKALLPKLADLPTEAEDRVKTVESLKREVAQLKGDLTRAKHAQPDAELVPALTDHDRELLGKLGRTLEAMASEMGARGGAWLAGLEARAQQVFAEEGERFKREFAKQQEAFLAVLEKPSYQRVFERIAAARPPAAAPLRQTPAPRQMPAAFQTAALTALAEGLTDPQQRILDTIAMLGIRGILADRVSVARWMGIHPNGGRYGSDIARLREMGYLPERGFELTPRGAGAARAQTTGLGAALAALDEEPQRALLKTIADAGAVGHTRESAADALGIHPNGGRYGSNIARLREMGLIPERGPLVLTDGATR